MYKILLVGSTKNKNISIIYSVAAELTDYEFILIGSFDNYLNLVNFKNYINIPEEKLVHLYRSSDVLLFPSLSEGFGLPIIEAQHFGLPVITSKYEPMVTVAGENSALFVNPKSREEIKLAICSILNDDILRKNIIKNGFQNAKKYNFENVVLKYKKLYKNILDCQSNA